LDHHEVDDRIMLENGKFEISISHLPLTFFSTDASVKDMEGAGIAWVADLAQVPYFCVKVVTDIVDGEHPTHEEFLRNLQRAAEELKLSVPKIIRFAAGKKLSDL
jgi:5'-methylthioadenosine nucleosidase